MLAPSILHELVTFEKYPLILKCNQWPTFISALHKNALNISAPPKTALNESAPNENAPL